MNGIALVEPFRRVVAGQPPQNNSDLTRSRRFALLSHVIEKILISRYTFSLQGLLERE